MMHARRTPLALAVCVVLAAAGSAAAKTLVVDADGRATASNCNASTQTPYTTVSDALTDAVAFDKIIVCPGTYDEHVHITIPVTITGKKRAVIRPTLSGANTDSLASGAPIEAVILVGNATSVTGVILDNITVDASATGATYVSDCSTRLVGVFYRNASGTVRNAVVRGAKLGAGSEGCQSGLGIFVQSGNSFTSTVWVRDSSVYDFQKNGITGNEAGTSLTATGNTVTGWGPTPYIAQNGIQLGFGASGSIMDNQVSNVVYSPCTSAAALCDSSSGILLYQPDTAAATTVSGNTVGTTQGGVVGIDMVGASIKSNRVSDTHVYEDIYIGGNSNIVTGNLAFSGELAGLGVQGSSNSVTKNTINDAPTGVYVYAGSSGNVIPTSGTTRNTFYNVDATVVYEPGASVATVEGLAASPGSPRSVAPAR